MLTQERLKEVLSYNPNTGIFIWKQSLSNNVKINSDAGTFSAKRYIVIGIDSKMYLAHRLVFLYMEGYFPEYDVDHINRNKSDNRWVNLRHVSRQCNIRNGRVRCNNTSGITGVSERKRNGKWRATIEANSKSIALGDFTDIKDAVQARWDAEVKYDFPHCNTTSSAYLYLQNLNKT